MTMKRTMSVLAITGGIAALGPAAPFAAAAGSGGTGGPWPEGSQGPCSPGGIWHPDPGWPGTSGWCEYPKKKKCWWSCPKTADGSSQTQATAQWRP